MKVIRLTPLFTSHKHVIVNKMNNNSFKTISLHNNTHWMLFGIDQFSLVAL